MSMTREEMDRKVAKMLEERHRIDAEARRQHQASWASLRFQSVQERPMTSDELNEKAYRMLQERQRMDAEVRAQYEARMKN